jgi:2-methylisocitrate lyase-like PEP mutase family enzyme
MTIAERRATFHRLHHGSELFVMPNAWDAGSARLLAAAGFPALATTSSGFAWTLGRNDQETTRDELLRHVELLAAATDLPLSVDSERCFGEQPAEVAETVRRLGEAGAAGCSIEDYDPATGAIDEPARATERVAAAAEAAHAGEPMVLTARAENHLYGRDDLPDTIARLVAYRDAGADVLYAPGLREGADIRAVVEEVAAPVNVLALPGVPPVAELARLGVRRVSAGGGLASAAYAAALRGAADLQAGGGADYLLDGLAPELRAAAFGVG